MKTRNINRHGWVRTDRENCRVSITGPKACASMLHEYSGMLCMHGCQAKRLKLSIYVNADLGTTTPTGTDCSEAAPPSEVYSVRDEHRANFHSTMCFCGLFDFNENKIFNKFLSTSIVAIGFLRGLVLVRPRKISPRLGQSKNSEISGLSLYEFSRLLEKLPRSAGRNAITAFRGERGR